VSECSAFPLYYALGPGTKLFSLFIMQHEDSEALSLEPQRANMQADLHCKENCGRITVNRFQGDVALTLKACLFEIRRLQGHPR
jgi:hypothetical protein